MGWTEERVELLKKLWMEGLSASQIAGVLGDGVTRNAVIGKVHRLKLSGRAKPASSAPRVRTASRPGRRVSSSSGNRSSMSGMARPRSTEIEAWGERPVRSASARSRRSASVSPRNGSRPPSSTAISAARPPASIPRARSAMCASRGCSGSEARRMRRWLTLIGVVAAAIIASKVLLENVLGFDLEAMAAAWALGAGFGSGGFRR